MSNFLEFYKKQKTKLDSSIEEFNKRLLKEENLTINDNLKVYSELNKSGKMIRGTLIMLGYKLNNNNLDYSIPLATAYEGFETSILVHDDIIDNDRRLSSMIFRACLIEAGVSKFKANVMAESVDLFQRLFFLHKSSAYP